MEELYEKYAFKIYKYIYSLCGNHDITEEILQETFYSAIKNIKQFKNQSSIYTWLCVIAKNKWKDYIKKNKKIEFIMLEDNIEGYSLLETDIENRDDIDRVFKIIKKLDMNTQQVIKLRIISEFSFKEIGEIFEKSEQWAKNIFYRGRIKIKEEFKSE